MHQVGNQRKLYYDAWSTNHQENSVVSVQHRALYTKTYVRVIVASDKNLS